MAAAQPGPDSVLSWEDGYLESFNGKLRDELLNVEIFDTLVEAQVLMARGSRHPNAEAFGFSGEAAQLTELLTLGPGGYAALASGPRSARPSAQRCLTGCSVPHHNW